MAREKGVATGQCPTCGAEVAVETLPDGGQALATCPQCFPTTEKAAAQSPRRERGVPDGNPGVPPNENDEPKGDDS